jgi:hypothetical protein
MQDEKIQEKQFQDLIFKNKNIKENILNLLNLDIEKCKFEKEVEFINGITSDFIIYDDDEKEMKAIIECKRADIGVTEYIRGVGQLFQYEYFQDKNIPPKKIYNVKYNRNINNNVLIVPSTFIKNTNLNIGRFRYPENSKIFEIHIDSHRVREITEEELLRLSKANESNFITISQYYVRDNRLFECYIAFQMVALLNQFKLEYQRKKLEEEILRKIPVINNNNWRNAFITLSSLGFLKSKVKIVDSFYNLLKLDVYSYINLLYKEYLYPFIDLIMEVLKENEKDGIINLKNNEIGEIIRQKYKNKDILFLTDSDNRYISSWLNIMRDDLGCIDFESRKSIRKINFMPKELDENERINKIRIFSKSREYIENFDQIKNDIIKGIL